MTALRSGAAALLIAAAPALHAAPPQDLRRAMELGRDQVQPCRALIDHDALELLSCVRYRAQPLNTRSRAEDARRLGAWFYGWVTADSAAAFGIEGADAAARELFGDMLALQVRLGVRDEQLCALMELSCEQVKNRKQEMLGVQALKP